MENSNNHLNVDQPRVVRRRCRSSSIPQVTHYAVQCNGCEKWRFVPTQERYEQIRAHLLQQPFVCEDGQEWDPDLSCAQPADVEQDRPEDWAIDRPNIPQAPPGWKRILRFRSENNKKLADVFYLTPTGKKLRSKVEVQKQLDENPRYWVRGVKRSQFSFLIPKPLRMRSAAAGIAEPGETSEANPSPGGVETRAAKRQRSQRRKPNEGLPQSPERE